MSSKGGEKPPVPIVEKSASFFAGFCLLLTLRVGLNAASFCIKRFQLSEELFSFYASRVHNGMELFCLIAVVLGTIFVTVYNHHHNYISIVVSMSFWVIHLVLLFVYVTGDAPGHLTTFYWSLLVSAFIYGLNQVFIFRVGIKSINYYLAAVPLSGIFISLLQVFLLHFFGNHLRYDTELIVVTFQIGVSATIAMIAAILWMAAFMKPKAESRGPGGSGGEESDLDKAVKKQGNIAYLPVISPILMCVIGLGLVYSFYPGIAPGMLVDFNYINKIDIILMLASSFPAAIATLICEITNHGPNKRWVGETGFYHIFLIFPVIEITCACIFIKVLHNPLSATAKAFKNPKTAGFFTILFFISHSISIGIGFAGVPGNGNSTLITLNLFLTLVAMNIIQFLGEGYIIEFRKYDRLDLPTRFMTRNQAFGFWAKKAASNAVVSIKSVFTTNLRRDLLRALENI